jgi:hypothetical protein
VAVQSGSLLHRSSHSSYQWYSNQAACYKSQPLFIPVAIQSGSLLHRASHSSYQWQSNQAACYTDPATLHTSGTPIRQPVTQSQPLFIPVALQSGSLLHRSSHSSYQWQSNQAACYTDPATLHTSGTPIRQPVTQSQPLFIPVAVQSGSLLHRASHSSYQWQSKQAACYTEPATLHTSGTPVRQPVTHTQPLFIPVALRSGSLLHIPSHSSCQWHSNQAACYTYPATLHASSTPIRQPVTHTGI